MIKAAFFDLDGTYLDPNTHEVPEDNKQVIRELQANGIKCYIASGRSYNKLDSMKGVLDVKWDGYVCNNGGMVFDKDGNSLKECLFSKKQVHALIQKCKDEHFTLTLRTPDYDLAPFGIDQNMLEAHAFFNEPVARYIKEYNDEDVYMALFYAPMDYDFYSIDHEIEGLRALPNRSTYCDVVLNTTSKAAGLEAIGQILDINKDEMIAFGDEANDLDMLQFAGTSVAMGNGNQKVKEICTYVTTDVDKKGLRKACIHYNLI